jgi:hypothetical protein
VKKHGFATCTECSEIFECPIFLRRKVVEWVPAADNLRQIKDDGLDAWLRDQQERQALLEALLEHYNQGRSMSFYCKACARMPLDLINRAMEEAKTKLADEDMQRSDMRAKAKTLKAAIKALALKANINLD